MSTDVVAKLWGFCHTLRHDGVNYGDYIEQITYLLFLKMADERSIELPTYKKLDSRSNRPIEVSCDWPTLDKYSGSDLVEHYDQVLTSLGKQPGILGDIFSGAQAKIRKPTSLKRLVGLIDETDWTSLDVDVKAAAFEGLLEKAASEGKKGAGQFFTPRLLIKTMVRCVKPDPRASRDFTIDDPAVGTGGFLVAAYEWLLNETDGALERDMAKRIRTSTYFGQEIDERPRRLALMNLYLHQVEPRITNTDSIYESPSAQRYDVVLTNPPFGTRGANQSPDRDDFVVATSNKQLNFLQHVLTILKPGGRAAVIVPDNVLFASQASEIFHVLMEDCDLHTVMRCPRGTFSPYTEGTKANVLFFTKGRPTERTWIYDARANVPKITKKSRPLSVAHFAEFECCYGDDPNGRSARDEADSADGRWRSFAIDEVRAEHYKLDAFKWIRDEELDDPDDLPDPEDLVNDALEELQAALDDLADIQHLLEDNGGRSVNGADTGSSQWLVVPLGSVLTDIQSGFASGKHNSSGEGIPHFRPMNVSVDGRIDRNVMKFVDPTAGRAELRLRRGDVLFNNTNSPELVGKTALFNDDDAPAFSNHMTRLRTDRDQLEPGYLALRLHQSWREGWFAAHCNNHVSQASIGRKVLQDMEFQLPPIAEQREIVAQVSQLLSSVDSVLCRIHSVERRVELTSYAVVAKAFRGELASGREKQFEGSAYFDDPELGRVPLIDEDDSPEESGAKEELVAEKVDEVTKGHNEG